MFGEYVIQSQFSLTNGRGKEERVESDYLE
jgi:hypothetical protein